MLLDSCSTDTAFKNPDLVANIRTGTTDEELKILTYGGSETYKEVADCKLLPLKVYFNKNFLANILSSKQVLKLPGVKNTTNTSKEDAFTVHLKDGKKLNSSVTKVFIITTPIVIIIVNQKSTTMV